MSKKIYITHEDDISPKDVVKVVNVALTEIPEDEWTGIVEFKNGLVLFFNDKAKNLSIWVGKRR